MGPYRTTLVELGEASEANCATAQKSSSRLAKQSYPFSLVYKAGGKVASCAFTTVVWEGNSKRAVEKYGGMNGKYA